MADPTADEIKAAELKARMKYLFGYEKAFDPLWNQEGTQKMILKNMSSSCSELEEVLIINITVSIALGVIDTEFFGIFFYSI